MLTQGPGAVDAYLHECDDLGFDIVGVSSGFVMMPPEDPVRLADQVRKTALEAKPEVGIQFGGGGTTAPEALEAVAPGTSRRRAGIWGTSSLWGRVLTYKA